MKTKLQPVEYAGLSLSEIHDKFGYAAARCEADRRGVLWYAGAGRKRER